MTRQQKKAKSSIEQLRLQEDPESKVGMLPDMQDLTSHLAADTNHVFDTNGIVANEGQPHYCRPLPTLPPEVSKDLRPVVKRLWLELTDPDRPFDPASVEHRLRQIRSLEKKFKTDFLCTGDMRQHAERYLAGFDGRRLPVPQAIKKARKKLKLTQRQLAELLGFKDHALISKYESGKRVPTDRVHEWLRKTENVTGKEPVKGNGQPPCFPVTSNGGKEASISPNMGESETSPTRQDCTPDDDDHPASTKEVL